MLIKPLSTLYNERITIIMSSDYSLIIVGNGTILDTFEFGGWIPLYSAIKTIRDYYPEALAAINLATDKVVWQR